MRVVVRDGKGVWLVVRRHGVRHGGMGGTWRARLPAPQMGRHRLASFRIFLLSGRLASFGNFLFLRIDREQALGEAYLYERAEESWIQEA